MDGSLFHKEELSLYRRQIVLPEVGGSGQTALKAARVLVVGAGGLGCPVLLYLAAAGVGTLGIVEFDRIERSNIHRQVLYGADVVGRSKVRVAAERLNAAFPFTTIVVHETRLDAHNSSDLVCGYDIVVDCTDNLSARYLVNDMCVRHDVPNVSASILRFEGQLSVFRASSGPCYRCLFPDAAPVAWTPSCAEAGVIGVLPGILGCLQANEVIKLILGVGRPLIGSLLMVDALDMSFSEMAIMRNPDCGCCGKQASRVWQAQTPAAPDLSPIEEVSIETMHRMMTGQANCILLDVRTDTERDLCHIAGDLHIPLAELEERASELPRDRQIICYCHMGGRSRKAAMQLRDAGFSGALSLRGGIDAWSRQMQPDMIRY